MWQQIPSCHPTTYFIVGVVIGGEIILSFKISLAERYPESINLWSDKNEKTPFEYGSSSKEFAWFKCPCGKHDDKYKKIVNVVAGHFRCRECADENSGKKKRHDVANKQYGELKAIRRDEEKSLQLKDSYWICECSCGEIVSRRLGDLERGDITTCGNRSLHKKGSNNSNWRGGTAAKRQCDRSSKEYSEWRNAVYAKDYYTCQCCGKTKNIIKNAHHIYNLSSHDDLKYDVSNGITLCKECHYPTIKGSFHNLYGTQNNTPEQLKEYINNKRKKLGITIPFSIDEYKNGHILKPNKSEGGINGII